MLRKRDLRILAELGGPTPVSELAATAGLAPSHASETVGRLVERELVRTRRDGKRKLVEAEPVEPVRLYQDLVRKYPHVDFPELVFGKAFRVLYYLDESGTAAEIAERADEHRNTVYRILERLRTRGIVGKEAGTYVLNDGFESLHRFARSLATHDHVVRTPVDAATTYWESLDEFLIGTEQRIDDSAFHLTGPRRFEEFGIQLVVTERWHYFYSESHDDVSVADVVCHALLVDDSPRYRGYCALLVSEAAVSGDDLRVRASRYGVSEPVETVLAYLRKRGEGEFERMADWEEFERLATEYGVEL